MYIVHVSDDVTATIAATATLVATATLAAVDDDGCFLACEDCGKVRV
jgi:hypothetical protein